MVEYGDGGMIFINTPLYYNKRLLINPKTKLEITAQLNK